MFLPEGTVVSLATTVDQSTFNTESKLIDSNDKKNQYNSDTTFKL